MIGNLYSGYLDVAILIWVLSGMFNLFIDKYKYEQSNMAKEKQVSRILGWIHIVIGTVLFLSVILVKVLV
ncbi:CLC_0170 family protein [Paenibacillus sp. 843]|uniref:CLC_0170 family protein n=1 Tax=Paenibacillus sp. 843 TaxID=3341795 RepID=UPI003729DE3C